MGERTVIDLNADVGEGFDEDAALLAVVTSANVACGFHAGDASTMEATCERAAREGVAVGAHVGYRDPAGFGRRELGLAPRELAEETLEQLGALAGCARTAGAEVRHVKPHGALYHRCARDRAAADAVAGAIAAFDPGLRVVGPPGSALLAAAGSVGLAAVAEGFADRGYGPDGGLVARDEPGAVLGAEAAAAQAVELALGRRGLAVQTLCVHGDTPGAAALARTVRAALEEASVTVVAPA
jgi:UPF0271 protein